MIPVYLDLRIYLLNVLVALDQFVNALLAGDPDETISSRAAKSAERGEWLGACVCRCLDVVDPGHCQRVVERDEGVNTSLKEQDGRT